MKKVLLLTAICGLIISCKSRSHVVANNEELISNKIYQAKAPPTQMFGKEAFEPSDKTTLRWLGMAGFL